MNSSNEPKNQTVALFDLLVDASNKGLGAARSSVGFAAKAKDFWSDPNFKTLADSLKEAKESYKNTNEFISSVKKIHDGFSQNVPKLPTQLNAISNHSELFTALPSNPMNLLSVVPGINLALGLFNLGIGVYNAVQLRGLRQEMNVAFKNIELSMGWHTRQLTLLTESQIRVESRLENVHEELRTGLNSISAKLLAQKDDEYRKKINAVTKLHRDLQIYLLNSEKPDTETLSELFSKSQELEVVSELELSKIPSGDPARLPYRVIQTLARRAYADVRKARNDNQKYSRPDIELLSELLLDISKEVFDLCNGKTLHWMGVQASDIIAQYVFLFRGLSAMLQMNSINDGDRSTELLSKEWDDGLEPLRALFARKVNSKNLWLPLGTLGDLEWYIEWANLDRNTADVSNISAVNLREIALSLGAQGLPDDILNYLNLQTLLAVALPAFRHQAQLRLMNEFAWTSPPELIKLTEVSDKEIIDHMKSNFPNTELLFAPIHPKILAENKVDLQTEGSVLAFADLFRLPPVFSKWVAFSRSGLFIKGVEDKIVHHQWEDLSKKTKGDLLKLFDIRGDVSALNFIDHVISAISVMGNKLLEKSNAKM